MQVTVASQKDLPNVCCGPMTEYVLVSGGSGGIGQALCRLLATAGYHPVIGFASDAVKAEKLAAEIGGTAVPLDLTSSEQIDESIALIDAGPHDLAGVVLAASPPPAIAPVFRLPKGELNRQIAVNVAGAHALLAASVRGIMQRRKAGWVVGILSEAMGIDSVPSKSMGGYVIAKYGLFGLLRTVEAEYSWLKVHSVAPGYTETPMLGAFDPRFLELMREKTELGRFTSPESVAEDIMALIKNS